MAGASAAATAASRSSTPQREQAENAELVDSLLKTIQALRDTIEAMKARPDGGPRQVRHDDLPILNNKDVDKPGEFSGNKWVTWEADFNNFLARRDKRWSELPDAIKMLSDKPLTDEGYATIRTQVGILNKDVESAFHLQLYEYL